MTDISFLKALRDKLKGGSIKSIHLNALPGRYATRLDLANLNYINPNFAQNFLEILLTKACFEFKVSFDNVNLNSVTEDEKKRLGLLSKRLNSLNIENDDNYKEHGIKTFSFGYPLLIKPSKLDPKKIIKAPIFIWQLEIIKAPNKVNTWSILRNKIKTENGKIVDEEIHSVGLNEVLLSFLKTDEGVVIPQVNEELLEDAIIDERELIDECYKVLKALNADENTNIKETLLSKLKEPFKNIPESSTLDSISSNLPWIHFGGVFGLFRTQKESIITDLDKVIEKYSEFEFDNLVIEQFKGTAHSAVETDPSQQGILASLGTVPKKIIQGPPGTGKSQSLTALITNALANNLKCLVVCEKKTALDVIKNNLNRENEQLGSLAAVIEDINKDRDGIVNSVRDRLTNLSQNNGFNYINYQNIISSIETTVEDINNQHKQLDVKIFQGKPWTNIVGEYLKRKNKVESSLLKNKLDYKQFNFHKDDNELIEIVSKLKIAKKLFLEVNDFEHPLNIINDEIFKQENPTGIKLKIEELCIDTIEKSNIILIELQDQIKLYNSWLEQHYSEYYITIKQQIKTFQSFAVSNQNKFGELFYKNDSFSNTVINTLSVFSSKYKLLKENRITFISQISQIKSVHAKYDYVNHKYVEINKNESLRLFFDNIVELDLRMEEWIQTVESLKNEYVNKFASDNLHQYYTNHKETIAKTESYFNQLKNNLVNEKLFQRNLSITEYHNQKISELELLRFDTKHITNNLDNFRNYFNWRKFYIELTELQKNVVKSIIELNCEDWVTQFESWYFYWLLSLNEHQDLPKSDDKIKELVESKEQLKNIQLNSILSTWASKQITSTKNAQSKGINTISLFNKRGSRGEKRNSLRKIIGTDFQLFTDFFPVLLVSPTVCSSVIPLEEGIFDVVIFDEASQLRIEDTFPALLRGRIKIISGDSQQMPPSNFFQGGNALLSPTDEEMDDENLIQSTNNALDLADSESLLVYAENCNYEPSYLKIHYRSQHPELIDFSNHAFYGKRLIPMPAKHEYRPIQFIQVNGMYEDSVNYDEAKQVIDILLNHIQPLPSGKCPSVGIATFNLYQRNLILEEITKVRQLSPENDKKISDYGSDLFVKNLENIQGDERDVIILSTTFGKRKDGSFRQQFGPILQRNGYKLLNVIVTRAKHKMFVCTSIPAENINQYSVLLRELKNTGRAVFYAYLAYAKAVSENNCEVKDEILKQLYDNCESKFYDNENHLGSESPFEEEVFNRLADKIGQNRLQQQYKVGGFRIDIIIKSKLKSKPIIAIECDGAEYHNSNEAYAWDVFRESVIKPYGFIFYRIWSTNWWFDSEKELNKLVQFITNIDMEEQREFDSQQDEFKKDDKDFTFVEKEPTKR